MSPQARFRRGLLKCFYSRCYHSESLKKADGYFGKTYLPFQCSLRKLNAPPTLTFPSPYATLFYRSKRSEYIFKSNDEESSLPEFLQRNPTGIRRKQRMPHAERDRRKADEHGFRAAHRTKDMSRAAVGQPAQYP